LLEGSNFDKYKSKEYLKISYKYDARINGLFRWFTFVTFITTWRVLVMVYYRIKIQTQTLKTSRMCKELTCSAWMRFEFPASMTRSINSKCLLEKQLRNKLKAKRLLSNCFTRQMTQCKHFNSFSFLSSFLLPFRLLFQIVTENCPKCLRLFWPAETKCGCLIMTK